MGNGTPKKTATQEYNELIQSLQQQATVPKVFKERGPNGTTTKVTPTLDQNLFNRLKQENSVVIDSLQRRMQTEAAAGERTETTAGKVAEYLGGDTHKWYETHGGREAFGVGALGGYGLGRLTLPVAPAGSSPLNRARIGLMAAGEAGLGPAAELFVSPSGPDNPHGQDVDRAYGNLGLGESFGATAAGGFKAGYGAFNQTPDVPPAAMQKLKTGQTGTEATKALSDFFNLPGADTRKATYAAIKKVLPNATEGEIRSIASAMTPGELGKLTPSSPIGPLRQVVESAADRWGTKMGATANVRSIAPEALGLPAIAGQAVQEVMFPGAPEAIRQEIEDAIPEGAKKTIQKYTDVAGPVERALTAIRLAMPGASKEEIAAKAQEAWRAAEGDRRAEAAKAEETRTSPVMENIRQNFPEPSTSPEAFDQHLAQLSAHFDKLRDRYGGAPASPGAQPPIPSGGGMPGITGIPGAGGPQAALGVLPGVGGGMVGGVPGTNVIHPSTAAFLRAMMQGRALGGGQ